MSFRRPSFYNPRMPRSMRKLIVTVLACSPTTSSRWFGIFQCQWKWTPEIIDAGLVQAKDAKLTVMRLSFPSRPLTFLGPCPKHMQSPRILGEVQQTWSFFFLLFRAEMGRGRLGPPRRMWAGRPTYAYQAHLGHLGPPRPHEVTHPQILKFCLRPPKTDVARVKKPSQKMKTYI